MTSEIPGRPGEDDTTGAIYDIIHTLGEEGGNEGRTVAMATGGTDSGAATPNPGKAPEHCNDDTENWLAEKGALNKKTAAQRRVLGCLGCRLATQPGIRGEITAANIAHCTGMENTSVHRTLWRLMEAGLLTSRVAGSDGTAGKPPEIFSFTNEGAGMHFKGRLEAPGACGLETGNKDAGAGRVRLNAAGEQTLIEAGIIKVRSNTPRAILGCLACRFAKEGPGTDGVYVKGVSKCQGINHGGVVDMLKRFQEAGIVTGKVENRQRRGAPRTFYTFTDSEQAQSIKRALETPPYCGLENDE